MPVSWRHGLRRVGSRGSRRGAPLTDARLYQKFIMVMY